MKIFQIFEVSRERNFSIYVTQSDQQTIHKYLFPVRQILPDYMRIEWIYYSHVNSLIESMIESKTTIGKWKHSVKITIIISWLCTRDWIVDIRQIIFLPLSVDADIPPIFLYKYLTVNRPMWINFRFLQIIALRLIWQQQHCRVQIVLHLADLARSLSSQW